MKLFRNRENSVDEGNNEVNMTPLIDISLVLVVILLLATPLAFQSSIALRNAKASGKRAEEISETNRVEIELLSEDSLRVNRRVIARADLGQTLVPLLEASEDRMVVITCRGNVSHGAFVGVLDEAKFRGAGEIAMVGR